MSDLYRRRAWQVIMTGDIGALGPGAAAHLAEVLDRMPEVPFLVIDTAGGGIHVARDYPSHVSAVIDTHLRAMFDENPALLSLRLGPSPVRLEKRITRQSFNVPSEPMTPLDEDAESGEQDV